MRNINEMVDFDSRRIFIAVASESIKGKMAYSEYDKKLLKRVIAFCNNEVVECLGSCSYYDTKVLFSMTYLLLHYCNEYILGDCEVDQIQTTIKNMSNFIKQIENIV